MEPIRVFVVDDHPVIRYGLAAMLAEDGAVVWVGQAADGAEALREAPALAPEVILIDPDLPAPGASTAIAALRRRLPKARFVALIPALDAQQVQLARASGAAAVLPRGASTQDLVDAIRAAHYGWGLLAPEAANDAEGSRRPQLPGADLTARERELLALMARGLANQEISERLAIAMPTVKFHVTNILSKLNAESRTAAVLAALRHKLVGLE